MLQDGTHSGNVNPTAIDDSPAIPTPPSTAVIVENIPDSLRDSRQWIHWQPEWMPERGKYNKTPRCPSGGNARVNNPDDWTDFNSAVNSLREGVGLGVVFVADDHNLGIDLDDSRNAATGEPLEWVVPILEKFSGTYCEISPSGRGYKIFARGEKTWNRCSIKYGDGAVEVFDATRYFTITGERHGDATEVADCQDALDWLGTEVFAPPAESAGDNARRDGGGDDDWGVIANGDRNNELLRRLGVLQAAGVPDEAIRAAAHGFMYETRPLAEDIDERVDYILTKEKGTKGKGKGGQSQAAMLVKLTADFECFHDDESTAYVSLPADGHRETHPVRSSVFRKWLARAYWNKYKGAASSQAVADALNVLEGQGIYEGEERNVGLRVAGDNDRIIIDLGTPDWAVAVVTADGWDVVRESPIPFRRPAGMRPLPIPKRGGDSSTLWEILNVREEDRALMLAWLLMAFHPHGPYPVLAIHGEQGSGKSAACEFLRRLTDPNKGNLRDTPRDSRDLAVAAHNSRVVAFDNLSSLPPWLSDCLCRLATGAAFSTRTLYSDGEETIFQATRPVIVNGIPEVAGRDDLNDRCISVGLERIDKRLTERAIESRFDDAAPGILGCLFDALAMALARYDDTEHPDLPRMADFIVFVTPAEPALGLDDGMILAAYNSAQAAGRASLLESDSVGAAIMRMLAAGRPWIGPAGKLMTMLEAQESCSPRRRKGDYWPKNARALSTSIRRIAPALRDAGVEVSFESGRIIKIAWADGMAHMRERLQEYEARKADNLDG